MHMLPKTERAGDEGRGGVAAGAYSALEERDIPVVREPVLMTLLLPALALSGCE